MNLQFTPMALIGLLCQMTPAAIINVPADHPTIQAAIVAANPGDEIVVAVGTYNEAINFNGKAITLRSTAPTDASVVLNTIIDGTGLGQGTRMVQCVNGEGPDTVLSGFVIMGGNATGIPAVFGGGMYNLNSSPTVSYCSFSGNFANAGGGMCNDNSSPTVSNCAFAFNWVSGVPSLGAGMYNLNTSNPTVTRCTFNQNWSGSQGGGMFNGASHPIVTDCIFNGNSGWGGGMYNELANPTLTDCEFNGNTSSGGGGGMYNAGASPDVTRCTFRNNEASGGGGMINSGSSPSITECSFTGNTASGNGGGMANFSSSPSLTGCDLTGNTSAAGGGIYNQTANPAIAMTVVAGNSPDQIRGTYTDNGGNSLVHIPPPSPALEPCPADINGDGQINVTDLLIVLGGWGSCP